MNNLDTFSFYKLLHKLLKKYDKNEIFLRTNKSLKHPHKEIEYVKKDKEFLIEIMVNFMGLQGNTSQLPSYMLDKLTKNEDGGYGWSLLFDFFNHYILWLFFETTRLKNYPRSFNKDFSDSISKILFSMLGINDNKIAKSYLPFAPLLLSKSRPKYYIQRILQNNFNLRDKLFIVENLPHQIFIAPTQTNKLGIKNNTLGKNLILGKTFLSHQSKIGIFIKNISYEMALTYLPNGHKYNELKESILFLTNHQFCVDLYLKINHSNKMNFILGDKSVARLGYGMVLGNFAPKPYYMHFKLYE